MNWHCNNWTIAKGALVLVFYFCTERRVKFSISVLQSASTALVTAGGFLCQQLIQRPVNLVEQYACAGGGVRSRRGTIHLWVMHCLHEAA